MHEGWILIGDDLRTSLNNSEVRNLAHQMALAEFLFTKKLTTSLVLCLNPVDQLSFKAIKQDFTNLKTKSLIDQKTNFDSHAIGTIPNLLFNTVFYYQMNACLRELITSFKKKKIFDETLIHIASEFDREPGYDEAGSHHGFAGHSSSLISGAFHGTQLIGDIINSSKNEKTLYKSDSTWGHGANCKEFNNRNLSYGNVISTISSVLNVKTITPNNPPLLHLKNGKWVSSISRAKNIEV
jgi:hypothetical protein